MSLSRGTATSRTRYNITGTRKQPSYLCLLRFASKLLDPFRASTLLNVQWRWQQAMRRYLNLSYCDPSKRSRNSSFASTLFSAASVSKTGAYTSKHTPPTIDGAASLAVPCLAMVKRACLAAVAAHSHCRVLLAIPSHHPFASPLRHACERASRA